MIRETFPLTHLKQNPFFNPRNKNVVTELYLSSLEKRLLKIEVPQDKFNNLTEGERHTLYNLKDSKTIVIKGADKDSVVVVWDRQDYIKGAVNQLGDTDIYEEIPNDAKPLINLILDTLENICKRVFYT